MVSRVDGQSRYFPAGKVTARLLVSILALCSKGTADAGSNTTAQAVLSSTPNPVINPALPEIPAHAEYLFTLRHIFHHGTNRNPTLHKKKDTPCAKSRPIYLTAEDGFPQEDVPMLRTKSQKVKIERLVDRRPRVVDALVATSRRNGFVTALSPMAWTVDDVLGPDVADRDTVLSLSYMAADAYARDDEDADWQDVLPPFNKTTDFGWESDGLRGHVFADETNSTVIIGLKGTSMAYFDGDGTTTNDKVNDNLFFSCCCAQQGQWSYHQVCDCATGTYECNNTCVADALLQENRYYGAGRELFSNVTDMYPNANIWLAGHSLGGAVSSLLGLTYGVPVVTFEAVPDALPAGRLGLPVPPHADPRIPQAREWTGAYHFGHTADPVYIGTCNGATASCSYFGYAMESQCHTGFECVYDVVADKGWRVGIGTHRIRSVIRDVILQYETVPECKRIPECRDCNKWNMYWGNGTETTTSTSPTSTWTNTLTRTETCKTPGWWGCLDETSTSTTTTTTTTTSTSQSTCKTPGWFGCKDKTTTETATTTSSSTTAMTTCKTPGWFWGCNDPASMTATAPSSAAQSSSPVTPPPSTHTLPTSKNLDRPTSKFSQSWSCIHRNWYGRCTEWIGGDQTRPTAKPGYIDEM